MTEHSAGRKEMIIPKDMTEAKRLIVQMQGRIDDLKAQLAASNPAPVTVPNDARELLHEYVKLVWQCANYNRPSTDWIEEGDKLLVRLAAAPAAPSADAQDAKRSEEHRKEIADAAWAAYSERAKTDAMLSRVSAHQLRTAVSVTIDAALSAQKEGE